MTTPEPVARRAPASYYTNATVIMFNRGAIAAVAKRVGLELRYERDDPFAVTLVLDFPLISAEQRSQWRFARQMLAQGRTDRVGERDGDVVLSPCACPKPHVIVEVADRPESRGYTLTLDLVDVNAALLVFDQIVALDAEPHIAPSLDAIGAELRAMLAAETGRGGDR